MNVDRAVFALAGTMVLASVVLGWLVSPYWLLLAAFVGANMLQAAFTGFCPAAMIFAKLGLKPGRGLRLRRARALRTCCPRMTMPAQLSPRGHRALFGVSFKSAAKTAQLLSRL